MIRKSIVCKLNMKVDMIRELSKYVLSSTSDEIDSSIVSVVDSLSYSLCKEIEASGFVSTTRGPRYISQINGGYSLYQTYVYNEDSYRIKLVLDVRVSDHPSHPNIERSTESRKEALAERYKEFKGDPFKIDVMDLYCKRAGYDVQIFIGNNHSYSSPIKSLEQAVNIVGAKVDKLIGRCLLSETDKVISKYNEEQQQFAQDYLDEVTNLTVFEYNDDDWLEVVDDNEAKDIRLTYIETVLDDGIFKNSKEFDELCEAIKLHDKYST